TVPVRTIEAKVAVADAKPMQAEQRQRWNPKDTAFKPVQVEADKAQPVKVGPDPELEPELEPEPVQADDTSEPM
ncbi:Uncharacterized protein ALP79_02937, partial [Pseudomonas savastanoi pv. fraxini]